jgi:acetate kinase
MLPHLLADLGPQDHPYMLYAIILGVIGFCTGLRAITGVLVDMRTLKKSETDTQSFATKQEIRDVHSRVDSFNIEIGKIRGEVTAGMSATRETIRTELHEVTAQLAGMNRSLGKLEGLEKLVEDHGESIRDIQNRPTPQRPRGA